MASSFLRLKARELRREGVSVKQIAKVLGVSKSSASIWVRDIILSVEQLETLRKSSLLGAERGRLKNALLHKQRWNETLLNHIENGKNIVGKLNGRELLIIGIALYWAEGCKKQRRIQFCNSDPKMILFILIWLKECFAIQDHDIRLRVGINQIHEKREVIVREYWSKLTNIPLSQFTKTSFKKVVNKKVFENFDNYYGTLAIEIKQSARFYGKIMGLIEGLAQARVAQR